MFFEPVLTLPLHRQEPFSLQALCRLVYLFGQASVQTEKAFFLNRARLVEDVGGCYARLQKCVAPDHIRHYLLESRYTFRQRSFEEPSFSTPRETGDVPRRRVSPPLAVAAHVSNLTPNRSSSPHLAKSSGDTAEVVNRHSPLRRRLFGGRTTNRGDNEKWNDGAAALDGSTPVLSNAGRC